jgi:hypothetical protein
MSISRPSQRQIERREKRRSISKARSYSTIDRAILNQMIFLRDEHVFCSIYFNWAGLVLKIDVRQRLPVAILHEIQRPKTCDRFGSTRPLKTGSQPIGGGDSVVTTVDVEVGLGATCKRSPLWLRSPMTDETPATARPTTRPMMAILLAARLLTRSEIKSTLSCMAVFRSKECHREQRQIERCYG